MKTIGRSPDLSPKLSFLNVSGPRTWIDSIEMSIDSIESIETLREQKALDDERTSHKDRASRLLSPSLCSLSRTRHQRPSNEFKFDMKTIIPETFIAFGICILRLMPSFSTNLLTFAAGVRLLVLHQTHAQLSGRRSIQTARYPMDCSSCRRRDQVAQIRRGKSPFPIRLRKVLEKDNSTSCIAENPDR